jgi:DNA-binding transcriptional regulator YiaG
VTLKSLIPKKMDFEPKTLGEHLKKRRLELGLFQRQVARELDISVWTYLSWELDQKSPVVALWLRIISFLGYDPNPEPVSLGEHIASKRRCLGLSLERASALIGVDEGTLRLWEIGERKPGPKLRQRIEVFIAASS